MEDKEKLNNSQSNKVCYILEEIEENFDTQSYWHSNKNEKSITSTQVGFIVSLLSFAVVYPSKAMAAYYCYLGQEPDSVKELPVSGDLLYVNIPPSGVNWIDVTFTNYSNDYEAIFNSTIGNPIVVPPYSSSEVITYPVVPGCSVTFSNASNFPETPVRIRVFGY